MAGGTWESTNKPVLPGLYMNFKAAAASAIQGGSRGTAPVPGHGRAVAAGLRDAGRAEDRLPAHPRHF